MVVQGNYGKHESQEEVKRKKMGWDVATEWRAWLPSQYFKEPKQNKKVGIPLPKMWVSTNSAPVFI